MPLSMMGIGEKSIIKKVGGKEETKRQFLLPFYFPFFYIFVCAFIG